jgi:hypothetical protein
MKKSGVLFLILTFTLVLQATVTEHESFRKFLYQTTENCEYDNWQSHISEGIANQGYNFYAPFDRQTPGFGTYRLPTTDELTHWGQVVACFVAGDLEGADAYIEQYGFPYETVIFEDTETNRTYYMLREHLNNAYFDDNGTLDTYDDVTGSFDYGWGLYVYDPTGIPAIITTPHPCDDFFTPALSYEAFRTWHARFWFTNGAGREVKWSNSGTYDNSKSLSDATRNANTALHKAYMIACDEIRAEAGRREFSFQIHSYDWNLYPSLRDIQATTGSSQRGIPGLPIRDMSDAHLDLANALPHIIIPANTIGIHDAVTFEDYFTTYYTEYPFYHYDSETDSASVYTDLYLAGYPQNCQLVYSNSGVNDYETVDPYFHIEEDELPSCYPQTQAYLYWFYGYDPETGKWDYPHVYDKVIQFYMPWVNAMNSILPELIAYQNQTPPTAPRNLSANVVNSTQVTLGWTKSSDYDFNSYEVLYSTEPIANNNYTVYSRTNNIRLANQGTTAATISGLQANSVYYFALRANDSEGLVSELSNEITVLTGPALISNFNAVRQSGSVLVSWTAVNQNNNQGFVVYRSEDQNGIFNELSSYETNAALVGSTTPNVGYQYSDTEVEPNHIYYYRVTAVALDGTVATSLDTRGCDTGIMYRLTFSTNGGVTDAVDFGMNAFASDGYDSSFDVMNSGTPPTNYIDAEFYEANWGTDYDQYITEVFGSFDPASAYKMWIMRVRTNQTNQTITVNCLGLNGEDRPGQVLFLRDGTSTTYWDLTTESPTFTLPNTDYHFFRVYMGQLTPNVSITGQANRLIKGGDDVTINFNIEHRLIIDTIDVLARNDDVEYTIATELPNTASSTVWDAPDVLCQNLAIVIRMHYPDGSTTEYVHNNRIGIVPRYFDFHFDQGWATCANPLLFPDVPFDTTYVHFFTPDEDGEFNSYPTFTDSVALWVHAEDAVTENAFVSQFENTDFERSLHLGWNLVPNQMFMSFAVKDLTFRFCNNTYSYAEAMRLGLIAPIACVYHNGYRQTDQIEIGESFYIFSNRDDIVLKYSAFTNNDDMPSQPADWRLRLTASLADDDTDELLVGSSEYASAEFDRIFDVPEPPLKPLPTRVAFGIENTADFSDYGTTIFNQDIRESMPTEEGSELTWPIHLDLSTLAPVTLRVDRSEFPANFGVMVAFEGNNYWLTTHDEVEFYPFSTSLDGTLHIYNEPVGGTDIVTPPAVTLVNAPNPFNPETSVRFQIPSSQTVKLSVYNIRGQNVRTLVKEPMNAGMHTVVWNGRDDNAHPVASGIYFCRLELNGKPALTHKMLLLK